MEQELSNLKADWRKRVVFATELEPGQMNRFDCKLNIIEKKSVPVTKVQNNKIVFKNKDLTIVINTKTGLIDSYKVNDRNCVGTNAFEPIVLQDSEDSWEMISPNIWTPMT